MTALLLAQSHQLPATNLLANVLVCQTSEVPSATNVWQVSTAIRHAFHAGVIQSARLVPPAVHLMVSAVVGYSFKEDNAINASQGFMVFRIAKDANATLPARSRAQEGSIVVLQAT